VGETVSRMSIIQDAPEAAITKNVQIVNDILKEDRRLTIIIIIIII